MKFSTVTVIGATGTMGTNVAGIFASFGAAKVYLIGRNIEKVAAVIPQIVRSVRADSIACNLIPADYSQIDECVSASDLVFDSTVEDISVKLETAKRVSNALRAEALFCSGTSGLSITKIAEALPAELRGNVYGVHMFNPPYVMPLCELISTQYSNFVKTAQLREYLKAVLGRTVVEIADAPAFLANRIGFQLINSAMQFAEKYADNGGIDYIDSILGPFTGRTMPPLTTADYVGLDVHKAIVDNVYWNTSDFMHDSFALPSYVEQLILDGKCGKKSGCGLYKSVKSADGTRKISVFDISTHQYRSVERFCFPFAEKMKEAIFDGDYETAIQLLVTNQSKEAVLCVSFLLTYILYALQTAFELGVSLCDADAVMATGFKWCPPLALCKAFETKFKIKELIQERIPKHILNSIDVDKLLDVRPSSQYDYRMYFKSI